MKCDTQITTRKNKRKIKKKKPRRHNKASITITPVPLVCFWGLSLSSSHISLISSL
jgi:hypothetical protein